MGVEYYCDIDAKMSQFYVFNIAKQCIKPIHINVLNPFISMYLTHPNYLAQSFGRKGATYDRLQEAFSH